MHRLSFTLAFVGFLALSAQEQSNNFERISLNVELHHEKPPFNYGMAIKFERPIDSIGRGRMFYIRHLGIPKDWSEGAYFMESVIADHHQLIFQNYHKGRFTEEEFSGIMASYEMDTTKLNPRDINSSASYIYRNVEDGIELIFDSNNNRNFSDDEVHRLIRYTGENPELPRTEKLVLPFTYEYFRDGQLMSGEAKMEFVADSLSFSGTFTLMAAPYGYGLTHFNETAIYLDTELLKDQISEYTDLKIQVTDSTFQDFSLKSVFTIGEDLYRFDSIIEFPPAIELIKFPMGYVPIAPQEGYQMPSFAGNDLMTGDSIRIEDYRGQFVYIDVWGSWCAPCIAELPNIKEAMADLADENITFIAVGQDDPTNLQNAIVEHEISWPNLLSSGKNDIVNTLNVRSYPTTFLVDPEGRIVAVDLRGENLAEQIRGYMQ